MFDLQNGSNRNLLNDTFPELTLAAALRTPNGSGFIRIPIIIVCTTLTFILLIAGTATTAISYPPFPPQLKAHLKNTDDQVYSVSTALDGDYKILGPLLIMAGGFLLIVDIALCAIVTKEAYRATHCVTPKSTPEPMSLVGGPFFLAVAPNFGPGDVSPLPIFRDSSWTAPNAPVLDYPDDGPATDLPNRPRTATLSKCPQPPFNPGASSSDFL